MVKDAVFGVTPLPGGGYAEYEWDSLSQTMRTALMIAAAVGSPLLSSTVQPRTLSALARRGIVEHRNRRQLTENGLAMLEWLASPDGKVWIRK